MMSPSTTRPGTRLADTGVIVSLLLLTFAALILIGTPRALGAVPRYAYVTNEQGNTVSVVDMTTDQAVGLINVGQAPRWMVMTPDLQWVFVSNHNSSTVSKISIATNQQVATIPVGNGPCWVEMASKTLLSVANPSSGSVSVVNMTSSTLIGTIPIGPLANWGKPTTSFSMAQTLGRVVIVTPIAGGNTVGAIAVHLSAPQTLSVDANVTVGMNPRWIDVLFSQNSALVYTTNGGSNSVSVINATLSTSSYQVVATIPVGKSPYWIRFTSDKHFAYVVNELGNSLSKISLATNQVVATIPVGFDPHWVAITPDDSQVYVPNNANNTVSVISVPDNRVLANVTVGAQPNWIDFSPDGTKAYVVNKGDNTVSVINTLTLQVVRTINVGAGPNMIITRPYLHEEVLPPPVTPTFVTNYTAIALLTVTVVSAFKAIVKLTRKRP